MPIPITTYNMTEFSIHFPITDYWICRLTDRKLTSMMTKWRDILSMMAAINHMLVHGGRRTMDWFSDTLQHTGANTCRY